MQTDQDSSENLKGSSAAVLKVLDLAEPKRVALIGNPNAGKTTLFNSLTGLRARTANFPGTTVDYREAAIEVSGTTVSLIDLPGAYCDHVVIAKLPFAVPDNPREAAHAELLEQLGRNPFMEISVPDAALRLVQAGGRLLRTEDDQGQITLLDRRVLTKKYGRAILDSLPGYQFDLGGSD